MGLSGSVYHIINHAFFKAALFMMVGAVYVRTHELDLRKLGGLWRSFPVTTAAFLVAAAGITGVPGLNGYTSKTLIHHAIEDAYKFSGDPSLLVAEKIFTVTSALTVCYIIKLTTGLFFGPRPAKLSNLARETTSERVVFALFAAAIIALGSLPSLVMEKVVLPAGAGLNLDPYKLSYLAKLDFFNSHDLLAIVRVLGLGLLLFFILRRFVFYRVELPGWLSVERLLYRPLIRISGALFTGGSRRVETAVDRSYIYSPYALRAFTAAGGFIDRHIDRIYVTLPAALTPVYRGLEQLEENHLIRLGGLISYYAVQVREAIYNRWVSAVSAIFGKLGLLLKRGFRTLFQLDYKPRGNKLFQVVNMSNLDFDLLIIVLTLIVIMGIAIILS
jgi:hydrogenase-4 component B